MSEIHVGTPMSFTWGQGEGWAGLGRRLADLQWRLVDPGRVWLDWAGESTGGWLVGLQEGRLPS